MGDWVPSCTLAAVPTCPTWSFAAAYRLVADSSGHGRPLQAGPTLGVSIFDERIAVPMLIKAQPVPFWLLGASLRWVPSSCRKDLGGIKERITCWKRVDYGGENSSHISLQGLEMQV